MKKWLTIVAFLLAGSKAQAIPACDGIDLQELKDRLLKEVHNEQDYKALKPYKWKICVRTLGTTLFKIEKDKADKIKEEQAETTKDEEGEGKSKENEDVSANSNDQRDKSKKEESTEDKDTLDENKDTNQNQEEGNKPEENKLSAIEMDIANHYLHKIYPHYPSP